MPKVSIITINYGQEEVTLELLRSLKKSSFTDFETIVIDNNSPNGPPLQIETIFPDVKLIVSNVNLGFAGGNNLGTKSSCGEYCFYINNDAEVLPDTIGNLVSALDLMPDVGGVSPKIKYFYTPDTIQYAGYDFARYSKIESYFALKDKSSLLFGLPILFIHSRGGHQIDFGQFDTDVDTPYLHGAAMMLRREAIDKAGMMSEAYFLYCEELDWSTQIRKVGYRLMYVNNATIFHKESVTTGEMSPLKTYLVNRNRGIFIRRNAPPKMKSVSYIFFMAIDLPLKLTVHLMRLEFQLAHSVVRAWWWNVINIGTKM